MINRIDIEETTDRVDELRSERDDLQSTLEEAREEANQNEDADSAEELDTAAADAQNALDDWDGAEELAELESLLEEIGDSGGDHQWEGNWYPAELIAEDDFTEYAEQLAEDIGAIPSDAAWPLRHIDWEAAANELRQDYASVTFRGTEYLYRSA